MKYQSRSDAPHLAGKCESKFAADSDDQVRLELTQDQVEHLIRDTPRRHRELIERMGKDPAIVAMLRRYPHHPEDDVQEGPEQ